MCNMLKYLLVLLAGRWPSFQTYLSTTHWYQALQAPQPPLLSPPHHHLSTSKQNQNKYNIENSLIQFKHYMYPQRGNNKVKYRGEKTVMWHKGYNITHIKINWLLFATLALASYGSCKGTSLTVHGGLFGSRRWAVGHILRAVAVTAGAASRVQSRWMRRWRPGDAIHRRGVVSKCSHFVSILTFLCHMRRVFTWPPPTTTTTRAHCHALMLFEAINVRHQGLTTVCKI